MSVGEELGYGVAYAFADKLRGFFEGQWLLYLRGLIRGEQVRREAALHSQDGILVGDYKLPKEPTCYGIDPSCQVYASRKINDVGLAVFVDHHVALASEVTVSDPSAVDVVDHHSQTIIELLVHPLSPGCFQVNASNVLCCEGVSVHLPNELRHSPDSSELRQSAIFPPHQQRRNKITKQAITPAEVFDGILATVNFHNPEIRSGAYRMPIVTYGVVFDLLSLEDWLQVTLSREEPMNRVDILPEYEVCW